MVQLNGMTHICPYAKVKLTLLDSANAVQSMQPVIYLSTGRHCNWRTVKTIILYKCKTRYYKTYGNKVIAPIIYEEAMQTNGDITM